MNRIMLGMLAGLLLTMPLAAASSVIVHAHEQPVTCVTQPRVIDTPALNPYVRITLESDCGVDVYARYQTPVVGRCSPIGPTPTDPTLYVDPWCNVYVLA